MWGSNSYARLSLLPNAPDSLQVIFWLGLLGELLSRLKMMWLKLAAWNYYPTHHINLKKSKPRTHWSRLKKSPINPNVKTSHSAFSWWLSARSLLAIVLTSALLFRNSNQSRPVLQGGELSLRARLYWYQDMEKPVTV